MLAVVLPMDINTSNRMKEAIALTAIVVFVVTFWCSNTICYLTENFCSNILVAHRIISVMLEALLIRLLVTLNRWPTLQHSKFLLLNAQWNFYADIDHEIYIYTHYMAEHPNLTNDERRYEWIKSACSSVRIYLFRWNLCNGQERKKN